MLRELLLGLSLGLAACTTAPPLPADVDVAHWRTASGQPLTTPEFEALRGACGARRYEAALDPRAAVAGPETVNPAYHPGGEGLLGAPPTGIARVGAPVNVDATTVVRGVTQPLEECLMSKGLVRAR